MTNRFRSCRVSHDGPLLAIRDLHEQVRRVSDLTAHHVRLEIDVELPAGDMASNQYGWVNCEAPVRTETVDRIRWCIKLLNAPIPEHPGLAVLQVGTLPNVLEFVRIPSHVVFHLVLQDIGEPRVVLKVDLNNDRLRRRIVTTKQPVDRVCLVSGVPSEPEFADPGFLIVGRSKLSEVSEKF
jgi:hypothetical protein